MKKYLIQTLGCKINQSESASLERQLFYHGYEATNNIENADLIIINTCTVTNRTDYKSRNLIKKAINAKSINKNICIIVTGCYSQRQREEILKSGNIDLILDNNNKDMLLPYLNGNKDFIFNEIDTFDTFNDISFSDSGIKTCKSSLQSPILSRQRAFIKIQDGCDNFCTYCAVPYARGKPRSRSLDSILNEINWYLSYGYHDLVVSGINLGLYNSDGNSLSDLLKILSKHSYNGLELNSICLSSIEPDLFSDDLLDTISCLQKITPHFHIPLQSGSDEILRIHNRKYNVSDVTSLVERLRIIKPACKIGFDVIVGLPHESDFHFEQTFNYIKSINVSYLHVFVYSKRKGTVAANMSGQVHGTIAKKRSKLLLSMNLSFHTIPKGLIAT